MGLPRIIPPKDIESIKILCKSIIKLAIDQSEADTADQWLDKCKNDTAQLWTNGDLWAITEVIGTKTGRVLHIVCMAGKFDQLMINEIERWAKLMQCHKSYFSGRCGWVKRLPDYKLKSVTLCKELS